MQKFLSTCAVVALISTGASAADLSSGVVDYSAPAPASGPNWAMRFGVAFDGYYVDQADNDEGTDESDWNTGGHVDFAVATESANGFGAQFDVRGSLFADTHGGDDDWTKNYLTGAVHLYGHVPAGVLGVFAGGGVTDDTGDSDESQTYWFAGAEGQTQMGSTILFGQAGYLDAEDEYDEGINQAGFARLGARIFTQPSTSFMAAISGAFGTQENGENPDDSALIGNLELEAERAFGNGSTSLFASYEGTFVSFDGGDRNTNFHGVMLGLRWRPGAADLMTAYSGPASLDLPSVDRWVAFTANEVE